MIAYLIIIIIAVLFYFLFWNKKIDNKSIVINESDKIKDDYIKAEGSTEDVVYSDENGEYRIVETTRELPRRTYIKGTLNGKYWGEIDAYFSDQFSYSRFFDFNVYEVTLKNTVFGSSPYKLEEDLRIPKEKLPKHLHTTLESDGKEYLVSLHEPVLAHIKFNRKLHQADGNKVFGTIDAVVTGYILDFYKETYIEKQYIFPTNENVSAPQIKETILAKTNSPTGNVEYNRNYKRVEFYYSDYMQTFWGDWKYTKPQTTTNYEGCFSFILGLLAIIIGIVFLLMMLPQIAVIIPFLFILFLLNSIPARFFSWLFRILGTLILLGFLVNLSYLNNINTTRTYFPKPVVKERIEERKVITEPVFDTINKKTIADTLIKHFRVWQDYDDNQYEGTIWMKKSDFIKAKVFKNNLNIRRSSTTAYDEIIFRLKENDKNNLSGVYQLFDSIRQKEQFSKIKFAELLVSFVQDIPYTVILPEGCNPNLYDDKFIKEYLSSPDARCDGFEKFGINSPVEFMSSLNGDCDTRTLILYTMLAHYGYDVAFFSSEYYAHSIIGINLPLSGIAYQYQNKRYVLWETTAPNIRAGILPKEISNLNYWRVSLKSK